MSPSSPTAGDRPPGEDVPRGVLFAACFLLEAAVFAILPLASRFPVGPLLRGHAGLTFGLLVAGLLARRSERWRRYWPVLYACFVAGVAVLLSTLYGDRLLEILPVATAGPSWIAAAKVSESAWRVGTVLALVVAAGASLRSVYLTRGKLGPGLVVGLTGFVGCGALAFLLVELQGGPAAGLVRSWPWLLAFVLANGFSEELLFRGLFLQRYERLLGTGWSNLLAALVFTLLHVQVTYTQELVVFLSVLFPLALAWGYLMQRTGSLWGSALFHAGADCLLVAGIFGRG